MATSRECVGSPVKQGVDEEIAYTVTTTNWGSSPSALAVVVKDASNLNTDVTSTVMPTNSPSASGDVVTLSKLKLLTEGHNYRVELKFTAGGNVFEAYFTVKAEL